MGPDQSRAVRVRVPVRGKQPKHRFGSGYVIAPTLVLTAAHTLHPQGQRHPVLAPGTPCEVLRNGDDHRDGWLKACVKASDLESDLAVVSVPDLGDDVTPLAWGQLDEDPFPATWLTIGFPLATLSAAGRSPETVWGKVSPASARDAGRLALTLDSRSVKPRADGTSGWAGLSGAAVFCYDHLVGVIVEDVAQFSGSLAARRIEFIEASPSLYEAAGSPTFARVGATGARIDLTTPTGMWAAVIAGFIECVRWPYYERAGQQLLGLQVTTWEARTTKVAMAAQLLRSTLDDVVEPVGQLLRGIDDAVTAKKLVERVVPIWVNAQAASYLQRAVEVDGARVVLVNVNHEQSAREYLQRAWCCDLDDCQLIGVPGVAGEEQLESVLADVRAGVERAWGDSTAPDDVDVKLHGLDVFVLAGQHWAPAKIANAVLDVYPDAHVVIYAGHDYRAARAAMTEARLIEPPASPEHEATARRLHRQLLGKITEESHG